MIPFSAPLPAQEPWMADALCRQVDADSFFPEDGGDPKVARRVCKLCTVTDECLEYAMKHRERFGVWGGLSARQRSKLALDRRRSA